MKTIEENNEMIAEFMGARHFTFRSKIKGMTFFSEIDGEPRTGCFPDGSTNIFPKKPAKYHSSWDWLMPIVEKISNLTDHNGNNYDFKIYTPYVRVDNYHNCIYFSGNKDSDIEKPLIEKVYNTVVEFIKWYNENK